MTIKIKLPQVTLVAVTSVNKVGHEQALEISQEGIEFGEVLMLDLNTHTIDAWNRAIIYEMPKFIETEFCMLIHADGYITHPELWQDSWLEWDYIGAPWPLPTNYTSYRDFEGKIVRVGNSVSLRYKKLIDLPNKLKLPWKSYYGNTNEDGFLCVHNRHIFERQGCKFAPLSVAKDFSKEHEITENVGLQTFAFHTV